MYKPGHVAYYFKENRMPFIIPKKNYKNLIPLKNACDSKKRIFLEKMY
jgi:hypothetical protein